MPASGWAAIGAVAVALAADMVRAPALVLAALAAAALAGLIRRGARRRAGLWLAGGALVLAARLVVLPAPAPRPTQAPEGSGPWAATVVSVGAVRDGQQVATLRLDLDPPVLVAATLPRYPEIQAATRLTVDGAVRAPPEGPYGDYLARTGVTGTLRSRTLEIVPGPATPGGALETVRRAAGDALAAAIPEPQAGLAAGIVVGLRDRVDRDLAADFTTVGASHVVAISGWNIAIVAATVAALAGGVARRRRAALLVIAIGVYVVFAGASPSVVRAAAMAGVVLLARESGRGGRAAAALGWAAVILLLADPRLVRDAGFQLSSLATAGILAWATPLDERLSRLGGGRLPGWLAESLAVSLAAQAATLPLVLATFGRLAIVSPAINLAVVPLVAPAMAACVVALVGGFVPVLGGPATVATLAGLPAWLLLALMCGIVEAGASLPFASATLEPPWTVVAAAATIGVPVGIIGARRLARQRAESAPRARPARIEPPLAGARPSAGPQPIPHATRLAVGAVVVSIVGLAVVVLHRPDGAVTITVLDVGQGDAILVEGGAGGRMLVDGGPDPDRLLIALDRRLPPWDRRLDLLVLTHPHEDHVAGLAMLLERYRVGRVVEPGMRGPGPGYAAWDALLGAPGAPPRSELATGDRFRLDGIRFDVLWPDRGHVPAEPPDTGRAINDVSIVLLGSVAGRRFLLTGDVEDDVDPTLLARGLPPVDVLKVAHHGSGSASTPAFLEAVRPAVAIVSAGADNPYGHPARSTVDRLAATGARVLRTDTDGSVEVTIATEAIRVATSGPTRAAGPEPRLVAGGAGARPASLDQAGALRAATRTARPGPLEPVAFLCGVPSAA